jgi:hypothetical protein
MGHNRIATLNNPSIGQLISAKLTKSKQLDVIQSEKHVQGAPLVCCITWGPILHHRIVFTLHLSRQRFSGTWCSVLCELIFCLSASNSAVNSGANSCKSRFGVLRIKTKIINLLSAAAQEKIAFGLTYLVWPKNKLDEDVQWERVLGVHRFIRWDQRSNLWQIRYLDAYRLAMTLQPRPRSGWFGTAGKHLICVNVDACWRMDILDIFFGPRIRSREGFGMFLKMVRY